MVTVGVRDLKNQLSQYLQFVKGGEKVVVTEHNKIIAEISAPVEEKSSLRKNQIQKDELIPEEEWLALTDEFINDHRSALAALAK